jgi:hypothetical protein
VGLKIINESQTALVGSKIIKENYLSPTLEIMNKIGSTNDAWIRQHKQLLWAQKSSKKTETLPNQKSTPKLLAQLTRGVYSTNNCCELRNCQGKLSLCRLINRHRNYFHN